MTAGKLLIMKEDWINIQLAPKPIDFDSEGAARLGLLKKWSNGILQLADPDGTLIDVGEDHG